MCTGILTLTHSCEFHTKMDGNISMYFLLCIHSTDTLTSWSKEGIITEVLANSTMVRCLSSHLSSFAVIAEDTRIEFPTVATDTTVTSATTATTSTTTTQNTIITDVSTSMKITNIYC